MLTGLTHMHSLLRWVILILLIYTLIRSFQSKVGKESRLLTITSHIMLLIGLAQWFMGSWGLKLIQQNGMAEVMKAKAQRFFAVEHALTMIIAVALITVAGVLVKKENPKAKWYYLAALILILLRTPWPFMAEGVARGWFPGMGV
jgi:hypothetical protein